MKRIDVNNSNIKNLQASIDQLLNGASTRGVSLSGQAHSDRVVSIMITVSGLRGFVQRSLVLLKTDMTIENDLGKTGFVWHCYTNGKGYELSTLSEFTNLIRINVNQMRSLALQR